MPPSHVQGEEVTPLSTFIGVGCFTTFAGVFAGGMIAVVVAKIVGSIRGCEPLEGTPACSWHLFALGGMVVGGLLLPTISIVRLKGRRG